MPPSTSSKKSIYIGIFVVAAIIIAVAFFSITGGDENQNQTITSNLNGVSSNKNDKNENNNTNQTSAVTNEEITVTGMVFLKGYKTPSESFGISTTQGHEIGLGKYDSMKEQFRAYIGENVKVTFDKVCKSTAEYCCRTLFYYCGNVVSWEPIDEAESTEGEETTE